MDTGKTTEVKKDTVDNTETPFSLSSAPEEPVKRKSKSSKNAKKKKFLITERSDFAKYVTNNIEKNYQYIWYKVYDNYIDNPEDFISSLTNKQIAKQIEIIIKEK